MLTSRRGRTRHSGTFLSQKSSSLRAMIYEFPAVDGLEEVSDKMAKVKAENLFSALLVGYDLSPISTEAQAKKAERFMEYLLRAFEKNCPLQVKNYLHLLEILVEEYDKQQSVAALRNKSPHQLLRVILEEEGIEQKSLVPGCFKSASQISEFLSQKKGREKLTADQALRLGKRFHLDPLLFLTVRRQTKYS